MRHHESWTAKLGTEPKDKKQQEAWRRAARTIAAYRDRYQVTDDRSPLGPAPESTSQKIDAARARSAYEGMRRQVGGVESMIASATSVQRDAPRSL